MDPLNNKQDEAATGIEASRDHCFVQVALVQSKSTLGSVYRYVKTALKCPDAIIVLLLVEHQEVLRSKY